VRFVFTLVGGHISPILVACEQIGIRVIDTRHEVQTDTDTETVRIAENVTLLAFASEIEMFSLNVV